jgi:hypothetical protein
VQQSTLFRFLAAAGERRDPACAAGCCSEHRCLLVRQSRPRSPSASCGAVPPCLASLPASTRLPACLQIERGAACPGSAPQAVPPSPSSRLWLARGRRATRAGARIATCETVQSYPAATACELRSSRRALAAVFHVVRYVGGWLGTPTRVPLPVAAVQVCTVIAGLPPSAAGRPATPEGRVVVSGEAAVLCPVVAPTVDEPSDGSSC